MPEFSRAGAGTAFLHYTASAACALALLIAHTLSSHTRKVHALLERYALRPRVYLRTYLDYLMCGIVQASVTEK